jgi:hypothetical protein
MKAIYGCIAIVSLTCVNTEFYAWTFWSCTCLTYSGAMSSCSIIERWILGICWGFFVYRDMLLHEAGYLKVADFGLCKLLDASEASKQYALRGETGSCKLLLPLISDVLGLYRHIVQQLDLLHVSRPCSFFIFLVLHLQSTLCRTFSVEC